MAPSSTPLVVALAAVTGACAIFAVVAGITSDDDEVTTAAPATTVAAPATTAAAPGATTAAPGYGPTATSAGPETTAATGAAGGSTVPVGIAEFAFSPKDVTVAAGGTVSWTNQDSFAHSVKASDDSFGSEDLSMGAGFSFTFPTAGTFTYICGIHPSMNGTVVVS